MILLFYKYIDIANPEAIRSWQRELCTELGLTGRVILAQEGINATLGGTNENCKKYIEIMDKHPLFGNIDWKLADGDATAFPKLKISVKEEIVRLGVDPKKVTVKDTGIHLSPEEVHKLLDTNKDLIVLDTRNDYEFQVGRFTNAIIPPINTFREFPEYIDQNLEKFKDKEVLMYCTGGVRCERATAYLNVQGVAKKVYQINGGIQRYIEKYPDGHFRGSNYVFDNRVTVRINNDILGSCSLCAQPWDQYINCINVLCNKHVLVCPPCKDEYNTTCGSVCKEKVASGQTPIRSKFRAPTQSQANL
jgi:UPF0176 protein